MTSFTRHYKDKVLVDISMDEIETLLLDENNKVLISELIYERLYNRFLKIFDFSTDLIDIRKEDDVEVVRKIFNEEYKNGFLIMSSCSLLIETLAAFLTGNNKTPNYNGDANFNKVFEYAELNNNDLKVFKNLKFYSLIRCGLLHQGEIYKKFKITRKGNILLNDDTVNATLFCKNLKTLLITYKKELQNSDWDSDIWRNCRNKTTNIIKNSRK